MSHHESIGQLALFPELFKSPDLPSISTLPEFDKALDNMIRMNDLGAFISINVHGLDKSYSVHIRELEIPQEFLKTGHSEAVSTVYYLFPAHIRHQLRKLTYDVRSFLNSKNSFKTSFGYFLFRPYFRIWEKYVDEQKSRIEQFLSHTLKGREYGKHFLSAFDHGYRFLEDAGGRYRSMGLSQEAPTLSYPGSPKRDQRTKPDSPLTGQDSPRLSSHGNRLKQFSFRRSENVPQTVYDPVCL